MPVWWVVLGVLAGLLLLTLLILLMWKVSGHKGPLAMPLHGGAIEVALERLMKWTTQPCAAPGGDAVGSPGGDATQCPGLRLSLCPLPDGFLQEDEATLRGRHAGAGARPVPGARGCPGLAGSPGVPLHPHSMACPQPSPYVPCSPRCPWCPAPHWTINLCLALWWWPWSDMGVPPARTCARLKQRTGQDTGRGGGDYGDPCVPSGVPQGPMCHRPVGECWGAGAG